MTALLLAAAGLFLLLTSGCDTFGEQDRMITLNEDVVFEFQFNGADVQTGTLNDIVSSESLSLDGFLASHGFSRSELRGARVRAVEIGVDRPIPERINFLNQALVKLRADNQSDLEVASQSQFPENTKVANMNARTDIDFVSYVRQSSFRTVLQINPAQIDENGTYEIYVLMELSLEIEGF